MARLLTQFFCIPAASFTERNCPDQTSRVFIVTGGYAGLGFELSQILYAHNAIVYVAGRSQSKATTAITRIKNAFPKSLGRLEFMNVDFSDLSTIKPGVEAFLAKEQRLDVLVNNAGVMFPPKGSIDAQGNELHIGTNCLGPCLLYKLLQPILAKTAASSPKGSVRVTWAGSSALDLLSPKPGGMELDDDGRPKDKGVQLNYGQSKVGNLFLAREFARTTPQTGAIHACFNPGNLKTELQRHWEGLAPKLANKLLFYPAINGAYTELWAALSPDLTPERSGAYVLPWGRIGGFRAGIESALKPPSEGGTGAASKFVAWCEKQTEPYI